MVTVGHSGARRLDSECGHRHAGGFTLMEVVVVVAVITLLASMIVPVVGGIINDARIARAESELKSIAAAMVKYNDRFGEWPCDSTCCLPLPFNPVSRDLRDYNLANGCETFSGAAYNPRDLLQYLDRQIGLDPWGNGYRLYVGCTGPGVCAAVLFSRGPDRSPFNPLSGGPLCTDAQLVDKNIPACRAAGVDDIIVYVQ